MKCCMWHKTILSSRMHWGLSGWSVRGKGHGNEKDMEILVESQLSMSQQHGLATMKANRILGCMARSTISRPRGAIIPPYLAFVRPHLEHGVQFWSLQLIKDIEKLE